MNYRAALSEFHLTLSLSPSLETFFNIEQENWVT